jgi:hypothetical protein
MTMQVPVWVPEQRGSGADVTGPAGATNPTGAPAGPPDLHQAIQAAGLALSYAPFNLDLDTALSHARVACQRQRTAIRWGHLDQAAQREVDR